MQNACGYITMIKTGKACPTPPAAANVVLPSRVGLADIKEDEVQQSSLLDEENVTSDGNSDSMKLATAGGDGAKMLSKRSMSLPVSSGMGDGSMPHSGGRREREADWVLLNLFFGVPLFDDKVNREVCMKIAKHDLCSRER